MNQPGGIDAPGERDWKSWITEFVVHCTAQYVLVGIASTGSAMHRNSFLRFKHYA